MNSICNYKIALQSAILALSNPARQDAVAALAETTSNLNLQQIRDRMLMDTTGRRILRTQPVINSETIDIAYLRTLDHMTFGRRYVEFLDNNNISPDTRSPIRYIEDPELAYVMTRYRQVHDFWHVLFGLETINVQTELELKVVELVQTGFPMQMLACLFGPLRLSIDERAAFVDRIPKLIQMSAQSKFLMNVMYEDEFKNPLVKLRQRLGIHAVK